MVSNSKFVSVGVGSPTEINAPRGCAVILYGICQLCWPESRAKSHGRSTWIICYYSPPNEVGVFSTEIKAADWLRWSLGQSAINSIFVTIQYLHSYTQKSIPDQLHWWDFCLPAYVFLRSAQQVCRLAEQLPIFFLNILKYIYIINNGEKFTCQK